MNSTTLGEAPIISKSLMVALPAVEKTMMNDEQIEARLDGAQ